MSIDRRSFLKTGGTLIAGAALGFPAAAARRGSITYGPVPLWTPFLFCKEPLEIQALVRSNDREDTFEILVYDDQGRRTGCLEFTFADVKEALCHGPQKTICLCLGPEKNKILMPLAIVAEGEKVTFLVEDGNEGSHPFWMNRADVLRVL